MGALEFVRKEEGKQDTYHSTFIYIYVHVQCFRLISVSVSVSSLSLRTHQFQSVLGHCVPHSVLKLKLKLRLKTKTLTKRHHLQVLYSSVKKLTAA